MIMGTKLSRTNINISAEFWISYLWAALTWRVEINIPLFYILKERIPVKNSDEIKALAKLSKRGTDSKRQFHVIRKCNKKTGENILFCKVNGILYIVSGKYLYLFSFTNSFKIGMKRSITS